MEDYGMDWGDMYDKHGWCKDKKRSQRLKIKGRSSDRPKICTSGSTTKTGGDQLNHFSIDESLFRILADHKKEYISIS